MSGEKKPAAAFIIRWIPVGIGFLLVLIAFFTGIFDKRHVFDDLSVRLSMPKEGIALSLAAGNAIGDTCVVMAPEDRIRLPAGAYRLLTETDADGTGELRISFVTGENPVPSIIPVPAGHSENSVEIRIEGDTEGMCVELCLLSGTYVRLSGISLVSPPYKDGAWILSGAFLVFSCLWLTYVRKRKNREEWLQIATMAAAVLAVSVPYLRQGIMIGHDAPFHLARFENLRSALEEGQVPARVGGFIFRGYGAASSIFYPDVFLVPFALMRLFGASLDFAYKTLLISVHAASCTAMYYSAKRITEDRSIACCSAILYTTAVYRLSNFYMRAALGESVALVFLPLFFCGLWKVLEGEEDGRLLAVSASCIFLSHYLSALLCAVLSVPVCLLKARILIREGRWKSILSAMGMALLLCAFQTVPLLTLSRQGIDTGDLLKYRSTDFINSPGEVFRFHIHGALGLFLPVAAGMAWFAFPAGARSKDQKGSDAFFGALVLAGVCILLTSWGFPWKAASVLTHGFSEYVQFPWRLLGFSTVFLSFLGGWGFSRLAGEKHACMVALLAAVLFALPLVKTGLLKAIDLRMGEGAQSMTPSSEYMLIGAGRGITREQKPHGTAGVGIRDFCKKGTSIEAAVFAENGGEISLPLFAFDGYEARLDGKRLETGRDADSRLTVFLPAGTDGMLTVRYCGKWYWHVFEVISLAAWSYLLVLKIWIERRKPECC